jgi:orotate phosphoribosyltransferase
MTLNLSVSKELIKRVKEVAFLTGEFTTRAGKKTDYYIDKYLLETQPDILDALTDALAARFPDSSTYDLIAAPELGAVPLASVLSIKLNKPFVIVKKGGKGYGTDKLIEGGFKAGQRSVLVEDVLTTGGAAMRAADILVENDISIVKVLGIINRQEGAIENIQAKGFEVEGLITADDLKAC